MSRPAQWRLSRDAYPVQVTLQTRFQDLDPMGHLNNVAFAAMFENARVLFNRGSGRVNRGEGSFRAVVARNEINYLAEGSYPEDVEVAVGIGRIGTRSWDILAAMFQNGRVVATCDTTIVRTDAKGEGLPADFREMLEARRVREG